jgi:hypothetical protein
MMACCPVGSMQVPSFLCRLCEDNKGSPYCVSSIGLEGGREDLVAQEGFIADHANDIEFVFSDPIFKIFPRPGTR